MNFRDRQTQVLDTKGSSSSSNASNARLSPLTSNCSSNEGQKSNQIFSERKIRGGSSVASSSDISTITNSIMLYPRNDPSKLATKPEISRSGELSQENSAILSDERRNIELTMNNLDFVACNGLSLKYDDLTLRFEDDKVDNHYLNFVSYKPLRKGGIHTLLAHLPVLSVAILGVILSSLSYTYGDRLYHRQFKLLSLFFGSSLSIMLIMFNFLCRKNENTITEIPRKIIPLFRNVTDGQQKSSAAYNALLERVAKEDPDTKSEFMPDFPSEKIERMPGWQEPSNLLIDPDDVRPTTNPFISISISNHKKKRSQEKLQLQDHASVGSNSNSSGSNATVDSPEVTPERLPETSGDNITIGSQREGGSEKCSPPLSTHTVRYLSPAAEPKALTYGDEDCNPKDVVETKELPSSLRRQATAGDVPLSQEAHERKACTPDSLKLHQNLIPANSNVVDTISDSSLPYLLSRAKVQLNALSSRMLQYPPTVSQDERMPPQANGDLIEGIRKRKTDGSADRSVAPGSDVSRAGESSQSPSKGSSAETADKMLNLRSQLYPNFNPLTTQSSSLHSPPMTIVLARGRNTLFIQLLCMISLVVSSFAALDCGTIAFVTDRNGVPFLPILLLWVLPFHFVINFGERWVVTLGVEILAKAWIALFLSIRVGTAGVSHSVTAIGLSQFSVWALFWIYYIYYLERKVQYAYYYEYNLLLLLIHIYYSRILYNDVLYSFN